MRPFDGRTVLLGVTGGIASYKSAWLARLLTKAGAGVDAVLTRSATEFISTITFEALTGRPAHTGLFDSGRALDHIKLAKAADAIVVAPATADFLARAATGQADDLLTAVLLATKKPVLLVPAMNDHMWAHPQTRHNVDHLRELGYQILEPEEGSLAAGEGEGPGRMPEPETIFAHIGRLLETGAPSALAGLRVLVTAGPTREAIDPVRFVSNHSSGKMGVALASSAWRRGADVSLIAGPLSVAPPAGLELRHVETTEQMAHAVEELAPCADVLIMAAAPADFRPQSVAQSKIKKGKGAPVVAMEHTPDILRSTLERRRKNAIVVGFALETEDAVANGRKKLRDKALDLIVVNDATEEGAGFGVDTNRVTLIDREGAEEVLPLLAKTDVADVILDRVERLAKRELSERATAPLRELNQR
ncbi:MAG TPA: bifunctional phosphopantothenoylcysteine decarboxylase/phosphopantothenate--cysteine ligase CoaBC [Gemmatimonadaceae bacterium]